MKSKIAIIILAAGSSSRLGRPKQLILKDGETLIRSVAKMAMDLQEDRVLVITGAFDKEVRQSLEGLDITVIYNDEWQEGIASSIRKGIGQLEGMDYEGALFLVCDQVKLNLPLLKEIVQSYRAGNSSVVCCRYGTQLGIPALLDAAHFPELLQLRGDRGAKALIQASDDKTIIEFEEGIWDIDEPGDLQRLG